MFLRLDWKFFVTLIITIAGVAVPIWLWQVDLKSKALSLSVKSTAEMQPQGVDAFDGVQVLVDGRPLGSPYVSVLELTNSGSKPIVASDFEGPIRISTAKPSQVVKARTTSSTPSSLEPALSVSEGAVLLQPLLLNPGDVVRFALVTADGRPAYSARARVAGVQGVLVNDAQAEQETKKYVTYWARRVVSTLALVVYMLNAFEFVMSLTVRRIFLPWSLATALISVFAGVAISDMGSERNASPVDLPPIVVAGALALPLYFARKNRFPGWRIGRGRHEQEIR